MGLFSGLKKIASGIPVIGGAFDDSDDKAIEQMQQNKALWEKLKTPGLSWDEYSPEMLQSVGELDPAMADYSLVNEGDVTTGAQLAALNRLAGLAETGLSEVDALGFERARQNAARDSRGAREALIASANARGVGGSAMTTALQEIANQGAAERSRAAAMEQAAEAARQRAAYGSQYMNALSGVRDQDYRANANNTDIINKFNMANTQARNDANAANLQARQAIANQNVGARNQAQQYNQEGKRNTQQQNFSNQVTRLNGMTGANAGVANAYAAQNAANQANRNANTSLAVDLAAGTGLLDLDRKKKGV